jgi:hypothetical protein
MPASGPEVHDLPRDTADDSCPEACLSHGICVRACGGSLVDDTEDECDFCFAMVPEAEARCEGWAYHCAACREAGNCNACNGARSVAP